jgi:hypothetical protein
MTDLPLNSLLLNPEETYGLLIEKPHLPDAHEKKMDGR